MPQKDFFISISPKTQMSQDTLKSIKEYVQKNSPHKHILKEEYGEFGDHHHLHIIIVYDKEKRIDSVSRAWKNRFPIELFPTSDAKVLWDFQTVKTSQEHLIHKYFIINKNPKDEITLVKGYDIDKIRKRYQERNPAQIEYKPALTIKEKDMPFFLTEYILKYHKDDPTDSLMNTIKVSLNELLTLGYATHLHSALTLFSPVQTLLLHKKSKLNI